MIIQTKVNNRKATVIYLTADMKPSTKEKAELVKIIHAARKN